jgi:hypothetical protein
MLVLALVSASDNTQLLPGGETHWVALKYIDNVDSVAPNAGWRAAEYWQPLRPRCKRYTLTAHREPTRED